MNSLIFDTESTDLFGNLGIIFSGHFLVWDPDGTNEPFNVHLTPRQIRNLDDRKLCVKIRDIIESANILVGFNSKLHDIRLLNARLAYWGERECDPQTHLDLYHFGRYFYKLRGASLAKLAQHLGVENEKTPLNMSDWKQASVGNKAALNLVIEHGDADVLVTTDVYNKMRHLFRNIHR